MLSGRAGGAATGRQVRPGTEGRGPRGKWAGAAAGVARVAGARPRGAEQVGPRAGRAGMSHGIGQGGREGPAPESQVSGGGAGGSPRDAHPEEVGLPLPSQARLGLVSGAGPWPAWPCLRPLGARNTLCFAVPLHAALEETLGVKSSRGHGEDELEVCLFPL